MSVVIEGRPDFSDHRHGYTRLRRFPPYVYSKIGMLVHRVLYVEAQWYKPIRAGEALERLVSPRLTARATCGQAFYLSNSNGEPLERATTCKLPDPDAVLCGRCHGTGPVFGKGLQEKAVTRAEAKRRLGCVIEAA